jgi:uncharacterized membrane protein
MVIDFIKECIKYLPRIIDFMGIIILMIGFVRGSIELFKIEISRLKRKGNQFQVMQVLRCDVGLYILLALDFMIASDIITSIIHTDINDFISLGAIVVLRTIIGYFLGKEVYELHSIEIDDDQNIENKSHE